MGNRSGRDERGNLAPTNSGPLYKEREEQEGGKAARKK